MQIKRQGLPGAALLVIVVAATACGSSSGSSSSSTSTTKEKATTTTTSVVQSPNAKLSGAEIKQLQLDLQKVGCFSGAQDGVIGPVTRAGIESFQKASKLKVDGQYGEQTRTKLEAAVTAGTTVCTTTTTTTVPSSGPPCTSSAISTALPASTVLDFGCDGGWAWAGIDTEGPDGYESVALLKANDTTWQQVDRAAYCVPASNIPPEIFQAGCTTS